MQEPLAFRMRPDRIEDIIGQQHLVGPGKIIQRMVVAKRLSSMILYGPPGIGKTSIASAIAGSTKYAFRTANAATDGKKELEVIVAEAKFSGTVVLLLDEIHRLNKIKQDYLLPYLESGHIILIGATTENPYISITPAIRSRVEIFELKPLTTEEILLGLTRALNDEVRGLGKYPVAIDDVTLSLFARSSSGDIRTVLNALELAVLSTPQNEAGMIEITEEIAEEVLQRKRLAYDKKGDAYYDAISALQKSIRGSDVDAALYYLAILLEAGDLTIACRRLLVIAYEDVGLGNPQATERTLAAVLAAEKLGLPEARIPLAYAAVELALSPKSNTTYRGINEAMRFIQEGNVAPVPHYLRNQPTPQDKQAYLYPHEYPGHWVKQAYLPPEFSRAKFFQAEPLSKYEEQLAQTYQRIQRWSQDDKKTY